MKHYDSTGLVCCVGHWECHAWRGSVCTQRYVRENTAETRTSRRHQRGKRMKEKGHRRGEKKTTYKPDGNFSNLLLSPDKLNYGMGESATRNPLRIYYIYIILEQESIILLYDFDSWIYALFGIKRFVNDQAILANKWNRDRIIDKAHDSWNVYTFFKFTKYFVRLWLVFWIIFLFTTREMCNGSYVRYRIILWLGYNGEIEQKDREGRRRMHSIHCLEMTRLYFFYNHSIFSNIST